MAHIVKQCNGSSDTDRWAMTNLDDSRVLRICQTSNGHGVRCISGRKVFGSASVAMPKSGCAMMTEAGGEHIAMKRHLFDPKSVKVETQPCRVDMLLGGSAFAYFPDFAILLADGRRVMEEHKGSPKQLRDPIYRAKLALAAEAFAALQFEFRVVLSDGSDLTPWERRIRTVRDANVELMFVSRFVSFSEHQEDAARRLLERGGGSTTLGQMAAVLDHRQPYGRAIAYSMAARRLLDIDVDTPISDRSVVRSVAPLPQNMPTLRL